MPHTLFLVPSGSGAGLTTLALGLVRALDNRGTRVAFFKPIAQHVGHDTGPERSTHFIRHTSSLKPTTPLPLEEAARLILSRRSDEVFERVLRDFHASTRDADVVVVEGLAHTYDALGEGSLNRELVRTLSAEVILVGSLGATPIAEFESHLEIAARQYGGFGPGRVIGCFVNRVPGRDSRGRVSGYGELGSGSVALSKPEFNPIGLIPENPELAACRTIDIARQLDAEIVHEGEIKSRRAKKITLLARTVPNLVDTLVAGSILVTPGDRADVVLAVALAAINKVPISGLILTGGLELSPAILELCRPALATGLPVLQVKTNTWETANQLAQMSPEIPIDDLERVLRGMDFVASHIDTDWIAGHTQIPVAARVSPAAFCYRLTELARAANKRIVLPEGNEPRTVRAAAICAERGIARCVLLGDAAEIRRVAEAQEVQLPPEVEILDPAAIRENYVGPLVEMRKHKGLSPQAAADFLEDNVWLGTMMLALGEVDGLVSGAVHSTANTIRPALQLIKTKPGAKVVSSIFFMCLPEQVLVYGDCAVIPDPDASTLADIAIQSADSAAGFGIVPSVAMISYSTGESGSGSDVDKVREATRIASALRPDLLLDGPLQYDAAAIPEVAASKAPNSTVAGRANVFIFPDLNTGNTTYKAVQRSANVISIGPMLQGLRRPVNDLSRGALVEDIVYTIALTGIQAGQG
ncbi:MAG TPA: phosphate acetyltransferase [Polyangiaceae bacterium]|nr:phosphate acetyltransferase [Polyangiaceae bacterium]